MRHRHARLSSEAQNLANELVLVTGGSGGIGQHIVEHLACKEARVQILDVKKPTFELPTGVAFYQTDITSTEDISRVASDIRRSYGDPTILVNAAGIFHCGPLLEKSEQQVRETFEVNTVSHFLLIKEFLPSMIKLNRGHIITVASMASFVAVSEMIDYCCTKVSALAFHEGIKQELKYCYNAPDIKTR
jgi:short-subunit dehydrogenase